MNVRSNAINSLHTVIEVRHIHTRFGAAVVHEDVSLTVNKGEVFAIAGGNGSGKSVLMREMILLQRPTAGDEDERVRQRAIASEPDGLPGLLHTLQGEFSPPRPQLALAA